MNPFTLQTGPMLLSKGFIAESIEILQEYWPMFLNGAKDTIVIALIGTIFGVLIGLLVGVIRTIPVREYSSKVRKIGMKIVNTLLSVYVEVFRGTPMIVQAMVIYYGAAFAGWYMDKFYAALFVVSLNTGAYMAEIVRGGILSVDQGQFEAAHSIGMTHPKTMLYIIMPQVLRNILPSIGNEFVINIKDTSVLNVISVTELYYQSKSIATQNFMYFQVFLITCIIYFIMTFTVTRLLLLLERWMEGSKTYTIVGSFSHPKSVLKVNEK